MATGISEPERMESGIRCGSPQPTCGRPWRLHKPGATKTHKRQKNDLVFAIFAPSRGYRSPPSQFQPVCLSVFQFVPQAFPPSRFPAFRFRPCCPWSRCPAPPSALWSLTSYLSKNRLGHPFRRCPRGSSQQTASLRYRGCGARIAAPDPRQPQSKISRRVLKQTTQRNRHSYMKASCFGKKPQTKESSQ